MNNTLCGVVIGKTINEINKKLSHCGELCSFAEIRVDFSDIVDCADLENINKSCSQEIIITCRRNDEGGKWNGNEIDRLQILQKAFDLGFLVDVELRTLEEGMLKLSPQMQTKTLLSFHDFEKTPAMDSLIRIKKRMELFHPVIKKIATMITTMDDSVRMYKLLINKQENERLCIIGMGENGKQTRFISPLLGSEFTYCTINNESSAPGQMSCNTMLEVYRLIK